MSMSVVIAGGGTGGHIYPALALADALRQADPRMLITCLGTERGLETKLIPDQGYDLALIPPVPLPRKLTPQLASVPKRMLAAVAAAAEVLDEVRADALVGFGGYVATPGYLAAWRRHVPIVVHEANPRPGLANRIGARFTDRVFTAQPGVKLPHAPVHRHPDPAADRQLDRLALSDQARAHFGLRHDLPVLLVTGGSQGARSINNAVLGAAPGPARRRDSGAAHHRPAQRRRPGARRARCPTSCCRTWTGWTWATRPPTSRCAGPAR